MRFDAHLTFNLIFSIFSKKKFTTALMSLFMLKCYWLYVLLDFTENFGGSCQRARNDFIGGKNELHQSMANFA